MIRPVMCCVLLAAMAGCGQKGKDELPKFQGTWKVVKAEEGGKALPVEEAAGIRFVITGNKMEFRVLRGDRMESAKGSFTLDPGKNPAEIDLVSEEPGEENLRTPGIYKFDADGRLWICDVKGGPERPKTFDTKDTPRAILIVLEKPGDAR